ncbi:protein IQ-DOMAIN 12 isoform X2 [Lotus japonicus]|uniref:protein IQ-DOMAIN 12 isoform X2 n=1 Tax=Lotus japonicus TaxID=34305 RepID=UPI002587FBAD|nr:protein IQ-DOMAIN 12 isoform X2 [Lotus japonicus]
MAKGKRFFGWVKRLFVSESKEKPKKWGWIWSIGRIKQRKYPSITAPNRTLIEASAEQRKHALTVAIATAAAAEAAVAAAHAAAEVVKLTSAASRSYSYLCNGDRSLAAIKIQSTYRAHLARKALRALKGVIRLQAIVRGQAVRRQVSCILENFTSNARTQVEIQQIKLFLNQKKEEKELKQECHGHRTWNFSSHSREDIEAIWLRKQEAIVKRERMRQYSSSQRERNISHKMEDSTSHKEFGKDSFRPLGEWIHKETCDWDMLYKSAFPSNITIIKNELQEGFRTQTSIPRKSFSHVKRSSLGDESSMPNSPVFPKYMAVTESSKAKVRSMSTPKQRTAFLDICSNQIENSAANSNYFHQKM